MRGCFFINGHNTNYLIALCYCLMRYILLIPLYFYIAPACMGADTLSGKNIYNKHTRILGASIGFPNAVDFVYGELGRKVIPPLYLKYEHALKDEIGAGIELSYFRKRTIFLYRNGAISRSGVRTAAAFSLNPVLNYHFCKLMRLKGADIYTGIGINARHNTIEYSATRYTNNTDEAQWRFLPTLKLGSLIYAGDTGFAMGIVIGYDWMSFMQLSLNYKL